MNKNSSEKTKNKIDNKISIKKSNKRINGGNTLSLLKIFSNSQFDENNSSNIVNYNSFKRDLSLKTITNNSSKGKLNKNINNTFNSINKKQNKISPSSGISKNKTNIIKLQKKRYNKNANENINKIKIPKGLNRNVNTNNKNKRAISPIYRNINLYKNTINKKISLNNINNRLLNTINYYKSYSFNNYKHNIKLINNWSNLNIILPNSNKINLLYNNRNDNKINNIIKIKNLNHNLYTTNNVLYKNYINNKQKNVLTQLEKSFLHNIKNKYVRLSPQIKISNLLKNLFKRNASSKSKNNKRFNRMKSPVIYFSSSNTIYPKKVKYMSKNRNNNIIVNTSNSFKDKKGLDISKKQKIINIYKKNQ